MQKQNVPSRSPEPALGILPSTNKSSLRYELLRRVGAAVLGTVMALGLVEIGFRLLQSNTESKVAARHDRPKYYYLPENSKFRDPIHTPMKMPGTFRIVVIGDSFTEPGENQYDDAFPQRLGRMLNLNERQRKVEVLNWGRPGFSTVQEFELAKKAVASFNPDLIILQITLNDPELTPYRIAHKDDATRSPHWLVQHWKSYNFIRQRLDTAKKSEEYTQYYFDLFQNPENWGAFSHAIKNFSELPKQDKIPVLAVLFPLFSYSLDARYPFLEIHKKIQSLLSSVSIPYVDLLRAYERIPSERLEVRPGVDGHPNEIAHRIAADQIYRRLDELKLIPEDVRIKRYEKRKSPHLRSQDSKQAN